MSGECQVNVKSQSELDISGRETCLYVYGKISCIRGGLVPYIFGCRSPTLLDPKGAKYNVFYMTRRLHTLTVKSCFFV